MSYPYYPNYPGYPASTGYPYQVYTEFQADQALAYSSYPGFQPGYPSYPPSPNQYPQAAGASSYPVQPKQLYYPTQAFDHPVQKHAGDPHQVGYPGVSVAPIGLQSAVSGGVYPSIASPYAPSPLGYQRQQIQVNIPTVHPALPKDLRAGWAGVVSELKGKITKKKEKLFKEKFLFE